MSSRHGKIHQLYNEPPLSQRVRNMLRLSDCGHAWGATVNCWMIFQNGRAGQITIASFRMVDPYAKYPDWVVAVQDLVVAHKKAP